MDSKERSRDMATTRKKRIKKVPDLLQEMSDTHNEIRLRFERVIKMSVICPEVRVKLIELKELL